MRSVISLMFSDTSVSAFADFAPFTTRRVFVLV